MSRLSRLLVRIRKGESPRRMIRSGVGRRLSVWGERLGWDWMTYNRFHFMHFHEYALKSAGPVIDGFQFAFPRARHFADVGAGSCAFAAEAQRRGLDVQACEHNPFGRKLGEKQGVRCVPFDLAKEPPAQLQRPIDVAYCFEVAEHLPPGMGDSLVRFLAELAPQVVFTAAQPGQGGTGHINEQPIEYWVERFRQNGYEVDESTTQVLTENFRCTIDPVNSWFWKNLIVFQKA